MSLINPALTMIEDAVEEAIEAAAEYVSGLPIGCREWGAKEYRIAEISAREAIAALRQKEAGKDIEDDNSPNMGY